MSPRRGCAAGVRAVDGELAPPYERPLAPEGAPEPALAGGDAAATAAERRSELRAAERQTGTARTAAAGRRPRPAP